MKQREIEELAIRVLQYLSQLPDDVELSTAEAVEQVDISAAQKLEFEDWFTLNRLIWDKSGIYGLKLDDSKYEDQVVGLLHHIPYVVKHKKGPLV